MYVRPSAPLDIGGVIDDAVRLYRASFSRCWLLALGFTVILAALQIMLLLSIPGVLQGVVPGALKPQQIFAALASPPIVLAYVLLGVVSLVFYGALFALQAAVVRGVEAFTLGRALAVGLRRVPGMLLASIVFAIAFFAGFVLLVIPGIYIWGKFQMWQASMFTEDASAMESLGNSWRLTRGRWWRTSAIFTIALIVIYVFTLALGLVSGTLTVIFASGHHSLLETQLVGLPLQAIGRVFVTPALPAVLLAMYDDCKLRSEGGDLATRVGALGGA